MNFLFRVRLFSNSKSDDANGVLLHVRRRRADDDKQSSFREFENKKTRKKSRIQSERRRQSELVEGEHRESRSRRFVLLFAFLFSRGKSRVVVVFR